MICLEDGRLPSGIDGFAPLALLLLVLLALGLAGAVSAAAAPAGPHWSIVTQSEPTYFKAGDTADAYQSIIRNDGALPTVRASRVTVTDRLPEGVAATKVLARGEGPNGMGSPRYELDCSTDAATRTVTCTYEEGTKQGAVLAGATIVLTITVSIAKPINTATLENSATVSGGGAPPASAGASTSVSAESVPFGLSYFTTEITNENGEADTQAGSHPFELTTSLAFNVSSREVPSPQNDEDESPLASASPKDLEVMLPPGLVGNPNAVPQCSQQEFQTREGLNCPVDTQVGTVKPFFYGAFPSAVYPVFDLVPPPGQPAELGFSVAGIGHVPIFLHLRSNGDYGLTASLKDIPEAGPLQGAILTLWGVPADASHDLEREGTLGQGRQQGEEFCKPSVEVEGGVEKQQRCPSGAPAMPFLTLPGNCPGATLPVNVRTDSWQSPEQQNPLEPESPGQFLPERLLPVITGCEALAFSPSLALAPETIQAGAPGGYTIELHLPQDEDPDALSTPDLHRAVVSLPAGVVISPSVANGLQGCSQEQFGPHSLVPASCPARSQIGTVTLTTPSLSSPLEGEIFVGEPECAPCTPGDAQHGRLIRLLLQAEGSGVTVKLEASASIDQRTGQLTARLEEAPQLPFEDLKLTLDGGQNAVLANPSTCGVPQLATAWLTPYSGERPIRSSSGAFEVSGCPPPQFHPSFVAGTTDNRAGAFSPATVTLSRTDQDEDIERVTVKLAPGLLGMLSSVRPCPQAQAQAGACGPQSQIGSATVGAGPGPAPLFLDGRVYLTGPYEGAPFGLSIVVPVIAGPFELGTIDVGARIDVDPSTSALTIASDPLPQQLDGIPLRIRTVNLNIDREGFIFNPTDCRPLGIEGLLESSEALTAITSSRFQAADCATLAFKPRLTALTHARASKAGGVYLHVKVVSGPGQANIAKLKVDLPRYLSTRLTTLQHACASAVAEANPADCPAPSVVGSATVLTPILHRPLTGPAYLVSHGGAALPELELVLQGEGVILHVDGQTSLTRGITSSAFRSLPDAPISSFELVLDDGAHSLLAANLPAQAKGSLCGRTLAMPTAITGQNGALLKQTTDIAVSGCPRHKA